MRSWRRTRHAQGGGYGSCDAVRQVISARFDGESPGLYAMSARAHLSRCTSCQQFEAELGALAGPNLQESRHVPAQLKWLLAGELARTQDPAAPRGAPSRQRGFSAGTHPGWQRGLRWVGALAPAVAAVVVLPLGVLAGPPGNPTHVATPCTAHLHHHHRVHGKPVSPASPR